MNYNSSPTTNNINTGAGDMVVLYSECLKNHAVSLGGHALDGCGEFIPKSTTILTHPPSLRWMPVAATATSTVVVLLTSSVTTGHHRCSHSPPLRTCFSLSAPVSLTLGSRRQEQIHGGKGYDRSAMMKKRKRTKFTAEQKKKMRGFAERAGWKINGWDEKWVKEFCGEVGMRSG